jgi:adenylate cyclase
MPPGPESAMQNFVRAQVFRPQLLALAVVLGLVLLPVAVWLDLRNLSDQTLQAQAGSLSSVINNIRSYYAHNVVGRVMAALARKVAPEPQTE